MLLVTKTKRVIKVVSITTGPNISGTTRPLHCSVYPQDHRHLRLMSRWEITPSVWFFHQLPRMHPGACKVGEWRECRGAVRSREGSADTCNTPNQLHLRRDSPNLPHRPLILTLESHMPKMSRAQALIISDPVQKTSSKRAISTHRPILPWHELLRDL